MPIISNNHKPDFVKDALQAWKEYLPDELTNLFYIKEDKGLRRVNAFILDLDEGDKLIIEEKIETDQVHAIKIGMGCRDGRFSSIFCIITEPKKGNFQYYYFKMVVAPKFRSEGIISKGVEMLFVRKWMELNDNELKQSFFGPTVGLINDIGLLATGETRIEDIRVNFYTYEDSDAVKIVRHLKENLGTPDYGLGLLFGAGLTVRITHPFDFRLIIQIYEEESTQTTESTFFERARPCPPYCNTAGF